MGEHFVATNKPIHVYDTRVSIDDIASNSNLSICSTSTSGNSTERSFLVRSHCTAKNSFGSLRCYQVFNLLRFQPIARTCAQIVSLRQDMFQALLAKRKDGRENTKSSDTDFDSAIVNVAKTVCDIHTLPSFLCSRLT